MSPKRDNKDVMILTDETGVSLRHLKAFVAVAEHKSFTKASQALHISQPALSSTVKQLENAFGVRLFDRTTRQVALTDDAEFLLKNVQYLVNLFHKSIDEFANVAKYRHGKIAVSSLYSVTLRILPKILKLFGKMYPEVSVNIWDGNRTAILQQLAQDEVDFAICSIPEELDPEFNYQPLFTEKFCLVCRKDFLPPPIPSKANLRNLVNLNFIGFSPETGINATISRLQDLPPNMRDPKYTTSTVASCEGLLMENIGFSIVPRLVADTFDQSNIISVPLSGQNFGRTIGVIKKASRSLSIAANELCKLIIANTLRYEK